MRGQLSAAEHALLHRGTVIPAHPLALDSTRRLDERRQRALTRYYVDAGAGGLAVAVHTTQFEIRRPEIGLLRPVLELAAAELDTRVGDRPFLRIAGVAGPTGQAVAEAELARELGYGAVLVSPGGLTDRDLDYLLDRSAAVGEVLPVIGFYLQEAVGGRYLPREYWRRLADQESTIAVKAAPFDRYRTLDLVQGIVDSARGDQVALYTGNDDNIVADLLTPYDLPGPGGPVSRRFVGGLLGHWAVWTRAAVQLHELVAQAWAGDESARTRALSLAAAVTDANAAVFDVRNNFAGVIAGVHEVLRRQGLLAGTWCLDPDEGLSDGQAAELTRISDAYEWLRAEDGFIAAGSEGWMS
ncbi:dihydrodipicolinate synthase family protein [Nocardia rhamnosiphila]|uniref:Dihydrodipicolinate synthase family protein n=1 Tax=Nocardia rhamnosiphila TaxID=426716 RepID=A0ABV2WNH1_9NOCA|nr:dihydrodipicolinate synthetase [Nocardia rhamnosiphila]